MDIALLSFVLPQIVNPLFSSLCVGSSFSIFITLIKEKENLHINTIKQGGGGGGQPPVHLSVGLTLLHEIANQYTFKHTSTHTHTHAHTHTHTYTHIHTHKHKHIQTTHKLGPTGARCVKKPMPYLSVRYCTF